MRKALEEPGEDPSKHPYFIGSLAKGLNVLGAFNGNRHELSLRDISEVAGVTVPSALRIAHTLVACDYLVRNGATKGYRLGPNAVSVGLATLSAMTLPEIADPYVSELRDRTDETVKLGIPTGTDVVVVGRQVSQRYPTTTPYIGWRAPLHLGSLGRAILAWMPSERIDAVLHQEVFAKLMPKTIAREDLLDELDATRSRGYALNDQGVTQENRSLGAPLLAPGGVAVGSINISISAQRVTMRDLEGDYAPLVVEVAQRISATLPPQVLGSGDTEVSA